MNRPTDPTNTRYRVIRGGCWNHTDPAWVRAASRYALAPTISYFLGFRCALRVREPRT